MKTKINWSEYYENGAKVDSTMPKSIKDKIYDKDGVRKIDDKSIKVLTSYINSLPQTKDFHVNERGDYTEDRKRLHKKIIDSFKKDLMCIDSKDPIAILMGGSPASGKSTFLRKYAPYLLKEEILRVDADEIRAKLPEYKGYNASQTQAETKDIVNGCPTPSEKPAIKTIAPNVIGVCANAIAPQHNVEMIVLHHSNWNVEKRWLSRPKKNLDIIVVPARIARITPIAYGEKLFSVPNNGKKTTRTSATEEIAKEM
jgi:hypothetical protein